MNPLLLSGLFDVTGKVLDRLFPDPSQKAAAQIELLKLQQSGELRVMANETNLALAQIKVNEGEAQNPRLFVSGARPFIMWICGLSLAYVAMLEPIARFIFTVIYHYAGTFPVIDTTITLQVLLGLLGLGGMRSFEKSKGVASK